MLKKIIILIISFIVFYDYYLVYNNQKNNKSKKKIISSENIEQKLLPDFIPHNEILQNVETIKTSSENIIINEKPLITKNNDFIIKQPNKNIINLFGKPSDYKENNYIFWDFTDNPTPWKKIIYKYDVIKPFHFYISVSIPSLNEYTNWKNILNNIDFEPKSGNLIIATDDEETALALANLIISNFKGDISFDEIINKNLIDLSITKAKKYEIVKNKIREQIIENLKSSKETFKDINNIITDSKQESKHDTDSFLPYEGSEYSFI